MLTHYDKALNVIYTAIEEINLQRPKKKHIPKSPQSVLFGNDGRLDSLDLANFIVLAEQKVQENFGKSIDLTQGDPFSLENGHFRTVDSVASHISELLQREIQ
jgi:acyl carrier protein